MEPITEEKMKKSIEMAKEKIKEGGLKKAINSTTKNPQLIQEAKKQMANNPALSRELRNNAKNDTDLKSEISSMSTKDKKKYQAAMMGPKTLSTEKRLSEEKIVNVDRKGNPKLCAVPYPIAMEDWLTLCVNFNDIDYYIKYNPQMKAKNKTITDLCGTNIGGEVYIFRKGEKGGILGVTVEEVRSLLK